MNIMFIKYFLLFVFINVLLSLVLLDRHIFHQITQLFTKNGGEFLSTGFDMEYNTKSNTLHLLCIRIGIVLYLCFRHIANILYVIANAHKYNYPWYSQLYAITVNPFNTPSLDCSWFGGMNVAFRDLPLFTKLQSKLYWNDLFEANEAPTPKIVGTIHSGTVNTNTHYSEEKSYIIKPIVGGLGNSISFFNKKSVPPTGDYIIQELVIQGRTKGHFRIVTLKVSNKCTAVSVYMCLNAKDKLASNNHAGGKCHDVTLDGNVRDMNTLNTEPLDNYFSNKLLQRAIQKATELHTTMPKDVISVGWDVMLNDTDYTFLEGNVPASTVFQRDIMFYQKAIPINRTIYTHLFNHPPAAM